MRASWALIHTISMTEGGCAPDDHDWELIAQTLGGTKNVPMREVPHRNRKRPE